MPNGEAKPSAIFTTASTKKAGPKATSSPGDTAGSVRRSYKADVEPSVTTRTTVTSKHKPGASSDKENERVKKEVAKIEAMDHSDIEMSEFDIAKQDHTEMSQKRQRDVEVAEDVKQKVSGFS